MAGLLQYGDSSEPLMSGAPLLGILPADELRLKLRLPLAQKDSVNAVMAGECQLQISRKDQLAKQGFVDAWSQAVPQAAACNPGSSCRLFRCRPSMPWWCPSRVSIPGALAARC